MHLFTFKTKQKSFLYKIVTRDEKWIYYDNPKNDKQSLDPEQPPLFTPKREIHVKKVNICVWWDQRGIIYSESLKPKQTVNANLYSQQLTRLSEALQKKRPFSCNFKQKVILLHDKARPHVAKTTRERIENLGWKVLPHPAYSPDLASSDYHLFRSIQHFSQEKIYTEVVSIKKDLDSHFSSRPERFYKKEIQSIPERWRKVILNDGNYFDD